LPELSLGERPHPERININVAASSGQCFLIFI
jgi:hypothetical protein